MIYKIKVKAYEQGNYHSCLAIVCFVKGMLNNLDIKFEYNSLYAESGNM